ncbi:M48 family metallopeptidase [Actinokineospora globicatena]|uniref:M48 family metallopeptidase n=1 Tax=Actinokineospora globicatena TaxID=103729 RepID=UPI0020A4209E|nr:M48 family metallopeptidase [Actinokineospora globicatena]MCP2306800.1 Zn-dependent protease with chaperone function [Actinokineospora globicatena]GLW82075.1 Zn-dependent protease [Actinokineospora globicatena]GLW88869.1 Zn-dependent protease [Actinokineospora globicatena]
MVLLRAALAVAMLVGFYLLALALVGGMVALEFMAFEHAPFTAIKLGFFVVPATFAVVAAVVTLERHESGAEPGLRVTPEQQPRLWALVNRIAEQVGTPPPDQIRVIADVNAAVSESTRFLGLVVTERRMYIGAPLLAALSERQLASVLAHELGHYANSDTRLSGIVVTGRDAIRRVVVGMNREHRLQALLHRVFVGYAKVYMRLSSATCRRQELAADAVSAKIVGSASAASALREVGAIGFSWHMFLNGHLAKGWAAGYLPTSIYAGFTAMAGAPEVQPVLDDIRSQDTDEDADPYDSHPPTKVRIAAIEALGAPSPRDWADQQALALLDGPERLLDRVLMTAIDEGADQKKRVDWDTFHHVGAQNLFAKATNRLTTTAAKIMGGDPTLGTVLNALDANRVVDLAPEDPSRVGGPQARRTHAAKAVATELQQLVELALSTTGHGRWSINWAAEVRLLLPTFDATDLPHTITTATGDTHDTTALRALLDKAGIPTAFTPTPP